MPLSKKRDRKRKKAGRDKLIIGSNGDGCASCGETRVTDRHHIDLDHNNDNPENLVTLCPTCHALITRGKCSLKDLLGLESEHNSNLIQPNKDTVQTMSLAKETVLGAFGRRPDFPSGKDYVDEVRGHNLPECDVTQSNSSPIKEESNSAVPWMLRAAEYQASNTRVPRYNKRVHKPGDRVRMPSGIETIVPELDGEGNTIPEF